MCYYCHIFVAIAFIIIMSGKDLNNILGISRSLPALIWGPCLFFFKFCFRIGLGSRTDGKCRISVYFIFSFFVRSRPWISKLCFTQKQKVFVFLYVSPHHILAVSPTMNYIIASHWSFCFSLPCIQLPLLARGDSRRGSRQAVQALSL